MFVTLITDCRDDNALGRVATRCSSLMQATPATIRVSDALDGTGEIEAAGNLVDALDASEGREGVILVNVAPRSGAARGRWKNGTPFGHFWYHDTLVLTTVDGRVLSLAKKLGLLNEISVIDLEQTVASGITTPEFSSSEDDIPYSQFRSFDFLPRVAHHMMNGGEAQVSDTPFSDIPDVDRRVWWIDNFGNIKTTMVREDIVHHAGETIKTVYGALGYHYTLRDVPDGETAIISGSSGVGATRLLEIVTQGGSAAKNLIASVDDVVL